MFVEGEKLKLTNLIEIKLLQKIQDSIAKAVGMASIVFDETTPLTKPSNYCDFCTKFQRSFPYTLTKCIESDLLVSSLAIKSNSPQIIKCYMGLTIFAIPIKIKEKKIGTIIGGQVFTEKPDENFFRNFAREQDYDEEEYIKELRKVKIVSPEQIQNTIELFSVISKTISEIAYKNFKLIENSKKKSIYRKIIDVIRSSLDTAQVEESIVNTIGKALNADRCAIIEYDKEKDKFKDIQYEYLSSEDILSLKGFDSHKFVPNFVNAIKNSQPFIINNKEILMNSEEENLNLEKEAIEKFNVKSAFVYPLYHFNELLGCIAIHYVKKEHYISDEEIRLISSISNQIAMGLYQAKLYDFTKIQAEREKISSHIVEILKNTFDKESILNLFVGSIGKYFKANIVFFSEYDEISNSFLTIKEKAEYLSEQNEYSFIGNDWFNGTNYEFTKPLLKNQEILINNIKRYIEENPSSESYLSIFRSANINACYNIPATYKEKLLGYFCIAFTQNAVELSSDEINRMRHLCNRASMALYHSELYLKAQVSIVQKTEFIKNISTDLVNALSNIIVFSEALTKNHISGGQDECFDCVQKNTLQLLELRNNIRILGQIESEGLNPVYEDIETDKIINKIVNSLKVFTLNKNIKLENMTAKIYIEADYDLFKQSFFNILIDLIRTIPENSLIIMKSQQENSTVNFTIELFNKNLSDDTKTQIFDTFKALDTDIDETKSINLGLSIAKKIIEKLKGKIFVESNESKNIAINISFPNQNKPYV